MQKCYKCNRQFADNQVHFCPYCGSPLAIDKEYHDAIEAKQRAEAERKEAEEAWKRKIAPVIERYNRCYNRFYRLYEDSSFPYKLPDNYSDYKYRSPSNDEELKQLEDVLPFFEDYLCAVDNTGDSNVYSRLSKVLRKEVDLIKERVSKIERFKRSGGKFDDKVLEFVSKYLSGYTFELKYDGRGYYVDKTMDNKHDFKSKPCWERIPFDRVDSIFCRREGWNKHDGEDNSHANEYEYRYYRCIQLILSDYKVRVLSCGKYGTANSLASSIPSYSSMKGKLFLMFYTDLKKICRWIGGYSDSYEVSTMTFDDLINFVKNYKFVSIEVTDKTSQDITSPVSPTYRYARTWCKKNAYDRQVLDYEMEYSVHFQHQTRGWR